MQTISAEQSVALEHVRAGSSVLIDAVPGSGKTTCVLHFAQALPERVFLLLTFNKALSDDTNTRVTALRLSNVNAFTFHAFVGACTCRTILDDDSLEETLDDLAESFKTTQSASGLLPERSPESLSESLQESLPDCLHERVRDALTRVTDFVVDEAQDIKPLLFRAWCALSALLPPRTLTHVLGDKRQGVYASMGADSRFLTLSDVLLNRHMQRVTFRKSHRLTVPVANFLNHVLLLDEHTNRKHAQAIVAHKPGPPVIMWRLQWNSTARDVAIALIARMRAQRLQPGDVFVLFPTVRKGRRGAISALFSRLLRDVNIPVYASHEKETGDVSELAARNKVVITTHHQSKGRERALTIVFGLDKTCAEWLVRNADEEKHEEKTEKHEDSEKEIFPDQLFVATTRATTELWVVQIGEPLKVVAAAEASGALCALRDSGDLVLCPPTFELQSSRSPIDTCSSASANKQYIPSYKVEDLTAFLKSEARAELRVCLDQGLECIQLSKRPAAAPAEVESFVPGATEIVSDINAVALTACYETHVRRGHCSIRELVFSQKQSHAVRTQPRLCQERFTAAADCPPKTPAEFLRLAAAFCAFDSTHWHKQHQLASFDWCADPALWWHPALLEIHSLVRAHGIPHSFERLVSAAVDPPPRSTLFVPMTIPGRLDAVASNAVYLFKAAAVLTLEHKVQALLYAHLLQCTFDAEGKAEGKAAETIPSAPSAAADIPCVYVLNVLTGEAWRTRRGPLARLAARDACHAAMRNKFHDETQLEDDAFIAQHSKTRIQEQERATVR